MRSETGVLIKALRVLALEIESGDGVANAVIAEAASRLEEQMEALELANRRLVVLKDAMGCVVASCDYLHHRKRHRHLAGEECPAEKLVREARMISE